MNHVELSNQQLSNFDNETRHKYKNSTNLQLIHQK